MLEGVQVTPGEKMKEFIYGGHGNLRPETILERIVNKESGEQYAFRRYPDQEIVEIHSRNDPNYHEPLEDLLDDVRYKLSAFNPVAILLRHWSIKQTNCPRSTPYRLRLPFNHVVGYPLDAIRKFGGRRRNA